MVHSVNPLTLSRRMCAMARGPFIVGNGPNSEATEAVSAKPLVSRSAARHLGKDRSSEDPSKLGRVETRTVIRVD